MLKQTEHRKKSIMGVALTFIFLFPAFCIAAEPDITDEDFFSDIPTVITVSRLEQPKSESPSAVTIIDQEMIKASGIRELADILNLVPGFIVGHYAANKPVVTYHGMGYDYNRQLQVLVDGRSVFIPSFGGIPWESLSLILEDIEKIEVTRGPNAASYGSNSFLAVINIITREAYQDTGTQISVSHSNDHKNIQDAYLSYSQQHDTYDWRISFKNQHDDGFEAFEGNPNNDSKRVQKFNIQTNFLIKEHSQWSFSFGQSNADLLEGDDGYLDETRIAKTLNRHQTLSYEYSKDNSATSITLFHTEHNVDDSFDVLFNLTPDILTSATVGFDRFSERTELEIQTTYEWSPQIRAVFGGSFRKDTVNSFFLLGEKQKQNLNVKRLFANTEYKINDDRIINLGVMLEDSDAADFEVSPKLTFIQHLNQQHTIRFSYSQAYRNPTLFGLVGRWAFNLNDPAFSAFNPLELHEPNADLKPEEIKSYEIGLNSQLTPDLETDLKLYNYTVSNQIVSVPVSDIVGQLQNSHNETKAHGIELAISYKPSPQFFIKSGFNLIHANSIDDKFSNSFPTTTSFILSQYDLNQYHSISGFFQYISNFTWVDTSDENTGSSKKLDLRYIYHFDTKDYAPISLEFIAKNVLSSHADYFETNRHSRSLFLKLNSHF